MKILLSLCLLLITGTAIAQKVTTTTTLDKKIIVKSNLLSLVAKRPTLSLEKVFKNRLSTELCYVQGEFNNILFTDHYHYSGFLLRIKKYANNFDVGKISPFIGGYAGNLKRNIYNKGWVDNSGFISFPSRNFSANSVRGGGTMGFSYISKKKWVLEGLAGLGYGRYINYDRHDPNTYMGGYLDMQTWFSVGYCF